MPKGLSIVIVSYKNQKVLEDCLDSVYAMNDIGDKLQVIVVEQSPTEDIYHFLLKKYPQVDTIRAENKGFGAGNNRGVEIAKHEYLLLLNPDTVLQEPIAAYTIATFENRPNLGLFGVQLLNGDGTKGSSFQSIIPYGVWSKIRYKIARATGHFFPNSMYIEGADMFVRKGAFCAAGGFDESVFMYCEESNLCLGIREQGYTTAFDGSKRIMHLQGACSPDSYGKVFERQLNAFEKLCKKYRKPFERIMKAEYRYQTIKRTALRCINQTNRSAYIIANEKILVLKNYQRDCM